MSARAKLTKGALQTLLANQLNYRLPCREVPNGCSLHVVLRNCSVQKAKVKFRLGAGFNQKTGLFTNKQVKTVGYFCSLRSFKA